jgi:hypothetical protein
MVARIAFAIFVILFFGGQVLYGLRAGVVRFGPRRYERGAEPSSFWTCIVCLIFFAAVGLGIVIRS